MKNLKAFKVQDEDFKKASGTNWVGSSYCVEVAIKKEGVAVRDSKNRKGGTLFFSPNEWAAFVNGVKDGEFEPAGRVIKRFKR